MKRRAILTIWLLVMLGSVVILARTSINFDLSGFLPSNAGPAQRLLVDQLRDGVGGRLMLLAISGDAPEESARISQELAMRLQKSGQFSLVANGAPPSTEQMEWLMARRYLLSTRVTATTFSEAGLHDALQENLQLLASPLGGMIKTWLPRDPTGEMRALLLSLVGSNQPETEHGVWFSRDRSQAILLAYSVAPGLDARGQQSAIATIHRDFALSRDAVGEGVARLLVTGPAVFAAESRTQIEGAANRLTLVSTLLVTLILCWVYRAWRPVAFSLIPLGCGLVFGAAAVGGLFGTIHGITLAFGAMLIGEAIDYPAYLYTHRHHAEALDVTAQRIRRAMWLAMLTTTLGALAMLLSDFDGLRQLGVFTAVGALAAGLTTRWILPMLNPGPYRLLRLSLRWPPLPRWLPLVFIVATIAVLLRAEAIWDDDLGNLSPVRAEALEQDRALRRELGAPDVRYLMVFTAPDREGALALSEKYRPWLDGLVADGTLGHYALAAQLLPSQEAQRARQSLLPNNVTTSGQLQRALRGLPFKPDTFTPFLGDLDQARALPPIQRRDLDGTIWAARVDTLLVASNQQWLALAPLSELNLSINAPEKLRAEIVKRGDASVTLLDLKGDAEALLRDTRRQTLWLVIGGIGIIGLLLTVTLGGIRPAVAALAPVLASMVITVGALVAFGERLNLFHLISLLLVLGIGLNYALFVMRPQTAEASVVAPDGDARQRATLAVTVCGMTSMTAFACLALSSIPVLHAIGLTVLLGTVFSLINVSAWRDVRVSKIPAQNNAAA